ncbi:hypothetical protein [Pandoraea faecigallinarum]|uniref:Uncharacterized protein n=1 Tax=Pandoraea faecigallinarum TaxID=656179 RepID=A0A173H004_9BURK|nr:hypothetical protein [Pandoraea faecigallinarum]
MCEAQWRLVSADPPQGRRHISTFKRKARAAAWATRTEHDINVGKITPGTEHTLADASCEYEKRVSPTKRSSRWEAIRFAAFLHDFHDLAAKNIADITPDDMGRCRHRECESHTRRQRGCERSEG